jgi:hypothetical protein
MAAWSSIVEHDNDEERMYACMVWNGGWKTAGVK